MPVPGVKSRCCRRRISVLVPVSAADHRYRAEARPSPAAGAGASAGPDRGPAPPRSAPPRRGYRDPPRYRRRRSAPCRPRGGCAGEAGSGRGRGGAGVGREWGGAGASGTGPWRRAQPCPSARFLGARCSRITSNRVSGAGGNGGGGSLRGVGRGWPPKKLNSPG